MVGFLQRESKPMAYRKLVRPAHLAAGLLLALTPASGCTPRLYDFQEMQLRSAETAAVEAKKSAAADLEFIRSGQAQLRKINAELEAQGEAVAKTSTECVQKARRAGARR